VSASVRLEQMLGRRVRDSRGEVIGRLEDVRVVRDGDDLVVREYLVGVYGAIERLAAWRIASAVLGVPHRLGGRAYHVPWQDMDVSDPRAPRLRRPLADLRRRRRAKRVA
jgi:sporulation protein YlmC with PRC-barrel domain